MKFKVLLTILLVLAVFAGCRKMTDRDKTFTLMTGVDEALKRYRFDCGSFPSTEVGIKGIVSDPTGCSNWKGPYIDWGLDMTKDFWGHSFIYTLVNDELATIVSYGADGKPGGSGQDSDITFEVRKRPKGQM